jgi:hypothetical protein
LKEFRPVKTPWAPRALLWLGHYQFHVIAVALAVGLARALVVVFGWEHTVLHEIIREFSAVGTGLITLVILAAGPYHRDNLCLRDVREATQLLDPQGEVDRRRGALRGFHWLADRRQLMLWLAALLLAPSLVSIVAQDVAHVGTDQMWNVLMVGQYLVQLPILMMVLWSQRVHVKLEPWCPFCRGRRGKEGFEPVEPVEPAMHRKPQPA